MRYFNGKGYAEQLSKRLISVNGSVPNSLGVGLHALEARGLMDNDPNKIHFIFEDELGVQTYVTRRLDEDGLVLVGKAAAIISRTEGRTLSELTGILAKMDELEMNKFTEELGLELEQRTKFLAEQLAQAGITANI